MVGVFFANIFDAKIVNDQRENDVFGSFFPKRGRTSDRGLSKLRKVELEAAVGNLFGLLQTGHALADIHVDPPIWGKGEELVPGDDLFWDYGQGHFHIIIPVNGGIVIEIINVQGEESIGGRQHRDIDEALVFRQTGAVGCGDAGEVKFVSHNRDTDSMSLSLMGPDAGHKAVLSHIATVWDIGARNRKYSDSASRHASADALCKPAEIIGKSVGTNVFVWTCDKVG